MYKKYGKACVAGTALVLGATLPGVAATAESESVIEEVVVTAQFREQSVQDTPLSITAVSGDMLEARSQTSIADVTNQAPNVTLKTNSAAYGPSLGASIRGVGQFDFNPALEPGVGLYVDDVYYATLTGSILDLLDLDRVEILRGPQGTLAGRNSIGGAVKMYSRKPTGEGGSISGTYGSANRVEMRGSADFTIADNLFARLSGVSKRQTGHVERRDYGCVNPASGVPILEGVGQDCVVGTMGDVDYSALRGQLRWVASDALELNAALDYTTDDRTPAAGVLVEATSVVNPNTQPVQGVTALSPAMFVPPKGSYYNYASFQNPAGTFRNLNTNATQPVFETRPPINVNFHGWGGSLTADWKAAERLSVKSISAYREYDSFFTSDNDLSPLASSLGSGSTTFHSFSQELRLNGAVFENDHLEYTLGAFYMNQLTTYQTTQDLRYSRTSLTQFQGDDPINADTTAIFGHLSYKITDALTTNLGIRSTDEHKDYTFRRYTYGGAVLPSLASLHNVTTNYDGSKVDYRVNLQYDWYDGLMTYVQWATGFKGGGISPRPFNDRQAVPFNPEELESYELGVKSDFFNRTLRVNAAVFFSDYTDLLLSLNSCPQYGLGVPCQLVTNAGDAEMKGAELEVNWRPLDGLMIDGSWSKLDFKYTRINPAAGGPSNLSGPQFGMRPAFVPETKWSLGVQYEFAFGESGTLTPRIDASYQGDLYTNGANANTNLIEAYTLANARLTWRNGGGDWETSLEVTNLTDEYYFVTRFDQYTLTGISDGQPGRPREYAVTIKRRF
jgi:iron complex outermembrane recepter protein